VALFGWNKVVVMWALRKMQEPVSLVILHSTTAIGLAHPDELVPVLIRDWTVEIFEERMGTLCMHQGVAAHIADAVCVEVIKAFDLIRVDLVHVKTQLETAIQDFEMTEPIKHHLHKMTVSRDLLFGFALIPEKLHWHLSTFTLPVTAWEGEWMLARPLGCLRKSPNQRVFCSDDVFGGSHE
jgi:hypothetical protein